MRVYVIIVTRIVGDAEKIKETKMKAFSKKIIGIFLSAVMLATSAFGVENMLNVFASDTDTLAGKTLLFAC